MRILNKTDLDWNLYFLFLLFGITALRLGYLFIVPLDLGPDETYYWDWSRRLDLGYFSKPPMIAWVNALSTSLLGISPQAVRMPAVIFGAVGLTGLYLCGRRIYNSEVAFWCLVAWLATPGTAALGLIMATDVLLLCCWCLALYTLWRLLENPGMKNIWWWLTLVLIGLGSLSKQMMMVFPILFVLYLLSGREERSQLKKAWPWALWGGSLLFLLPPLWWNYRHGWITFRHTAHHIEKVDMSILDRLSMLAEFVGGQMGLLSPATWIMLVAVLISLSAGLFKLQKRERFLLFFSCSGLFLFACLSAKQSINPNWPAAFYPAGLILLAAWGRGALSLGAVDRLRRWFIPAIAIGLGLTLIAYLLPFVMSVSALSLGKKDVTWRLKGWQALSLDVHAVVQQLPKPQQTFILSPLRKYVSEIAFYMPGHPVTYKWSGNPSQRSSQYDLWPDPSDKLGWDALIVFNSNQQLPESLINCFADVVDLGERSVDIGAAGKRRYHLWRAEKLIRWPGEKK